MNNCMFRAWDIANKEMLKIDVIDFFLKEIRVLEDDGSVFSMKLKNVILMQYTGLLDIKDKKIYEGDIVEVDGVKYQVHFDKETFSYVLIVINASNKTRWMYLYEAKNNIKVIGNIFENEDLIGA